MKKRILTMILAAVLLLSVPVVPVQATASANVTPVTDTCPCGCGEKLQDVQWMVWAENPSAGHYYLDSDYVQSAQITVLSDTPVVLDLRGHTITTANNERLFLVNGFLHVMDTVGGGRMMAKGTASGNGGVVLVEENEMVGPAFYLYSGTITPDPDAVKTVAAGGLVYVGDGSSFRMTGGLLMSGYAKTAYGGGAVGSRVSNSTIEILGGTILNCATSGNGGSLYSPGKIYVENAAILGGEAAGYGGNIHITGTSAELTVKNSVIANGVALGTPTGTKYGGGNISVYSGAKATVSGSQILGGYAQCVGGNLSLGRGTTVITNCEISGGTAKEAGGNVYSNLSTAKVTFDGGSVDGNFYSGTAKLTLKGALKVSNKGLGLQMGSGTLTASGLSSGAEIYVSGNKTLAGSASYYKAANRASLDGLTLTMGDTGYCSQCGENVTWAAYGTAGATHVYLTEDLNDFTQVTVEDELVIDLCGFSITAPGRAFNVAAGGKLQIIDSVGTGTVTGSGADGEAGGVVANSGALTIYGGTYTYLASSATVAGGGVIYNTGIATITGAVLDGSKFVNTESNGGAVLLADGENVSLSMNGGYVLGGSAYYGGSLQSGYKNTVTLLGSHFMGGKAVTGGNVSNFHNTAAKAGTMTADYCRFADGKGTKLDTSADAFGGNIYTGRYTATFNNCLILDGESEKYGGNINVSNSTAVTYNDCFLVGGKAASGGNVYCPGNSVNVTFNGCMITNGTATSGGNLTVNNGEAKIYGGEVSYGTAAANGGNIHSRTDDKTGLTLGDDSSGNAPLVCHGTADSYGGNLYLGNVATVNAAFVHSGSASKGNDLYVIGTDTTLTLGKGVTGTIRMNTSSGLLTEAVYGGAVSNITCNAENAVFLMDAEYGECGVVVEGATMYVATTAVVNDSGNATWYSSNADAVAACDANSYVKLFTDNDLVLTKDLYVDLNGKNVNVSGNYKFCGMDSTGDGYAEPMGSVTGVNAATYDVTEAPNGNTYVAVAGAEGVTYHRLFMKITGVNIRPSASGMYYNAKWYCDDTLKDLVGTYGVVASTANMPGSDFASEEENLYTVFEKESLVSGQTQNSAVITGIMKDRTEAENEEAGKMSIYAKAYMTFADGTTLVSGDNIQYSLYDVMKGLDRLVIEQPDRYRKYLSAARSFFETWKDNGMASWKLSKIPQPADDGVIDVLMIGNSWCYYYVEELYALAEAAGVKMRVCNAYYSGCPIENHYNWWKNSEAHYQYYETDGNGRKEKGNGVSLEWCLAQGEWDVITMNTGGGDMRTLSAEGNVAKNKDYVVELFDYFKESFPKADFYFHQTWAYELGFVKEYASGDFRIDTVADQEAFTEKTRQIVGAYVEAAGIGRINTGDAWELYRAACDAAGIEHNLCARLGNNNNQGDGSHDGDIGGGQYLNALVWFEVLTGKDCRETTYIPTYTYDGTQYPMGETMAEMLQDAAHEAASEMLPAYPNYAN